MKDADSQIIGLLREVKEAGSSASGMMFTQNGTGAVARSVQSKLGEIKTPKDFGAVGDGVADDTAAVQAAVNTKNLMLTDGLYKCTATITVPNGTSWGGSGKQRALLVGALTGVPLLQLGPTTSSARNINLKDFGIIGGASPGTHALTAWALNTCDIDIYVNGGWDHQLYIWRVASGISGPEGGYIQGSTIKLWQVHADDALPVSAASVPDPKGGIYVRGWVNASSIYQNIGSTQSSGDGIHLEGTYGSANDCDISGQLQGVNGYAVYMSGTSTNTHIHDLHAEGNIGGDLNITGVNKLKVGPNVAGALSLTTCTSPMIEGLSGVITLATDVTNPIILGGNSSDAMPIVHNGVRWTPLGWSQWASASSLKNPGGFNIGDSINLIQGGDFSRWIGAGGTGENIWGTFTGGYYYGTKTGIGLADTTHTRNAAYAAKLTNHPSFGSVIAWQIIPAGVLDAAQAGQTITFSFKWKKSVAGNLYGGVMSASTPTNQGDLVETMSFPCENGFQRFVVTAKITSLMVTNGVVVNIAFPSPTVAYISEVQASIGGAATSDFVRQEWDATGTVRLENGNLIARGTAAPSSGGDPVYNKNWQIGDKVINSAPATSTATGWVCTVAGSPGTWVALAPLGLTAPATYVLSVASDFTPTVAEQDETAASVTLPAGKYLITLGVNATGNDEMFLHMTASSALTSSINYIFLSNAASPMPTTGGEGLLGASGWSLADNDPVGGSGAVITNPATQTVSLKFLRIGTTGALKAGSSIILTKVN